VASSNSVALAQPWPPKGLTRRETEALHLVGAGLSNKEIAWQLGLSVGTVKLYVHHVLQKTGARSRSELVVRMAYASKGQG
jgi:DNA-binding NarL/FixJ family response regulator